MRLLFVIWQQIVNQDIVVQRERENALSTNIIIIKVNVKGIVTQIAIYIITKALRFFFTINEYN